ncbi:Organic cation transporter 1 [Trichostrongylus colubriformis]|uniref:Organic cation transporter 1 n=1 Tax=Trichostrongylus colubriformis TaxID=6319 RepID=A0AAN8IA84_TRICO
MRRAVKQEQLAELGTEILLGPANVIDFDYVLSQVGEFGPYQILFFFIICLPASIPSAFSAFNQPFVVGSPPHNCRLPPGRDDLKPQDADPDLSKCYQYNQTQVDFYRSFTSSPISSYRDEISLVPCQTGWEFDNSTYSDSLVTEFNLVCDRQHWVEISTTAFYLGSFIGNFLFGWVADKFGRRRSFFIILASLVIFGTANAFVQNIESFVVVRFLTGLPFPALFQIPFIICMEFMGKSGRIFSGLMISLFFGAAMALLGVVAMFIRRWRQLTFVCNAPFAALFCYYFFLPESPRWLVSAGKWSEASAQLQRIANMNGRKDEVDVEELLESLRENQCLGADGERRSRNVTDLFRTPNLRKKTMLVTYIWIMNAIIYNGLTLNISNLPVDDYWSFIINGAVELPAYFIVWPLLQTIGRRWTLASTMLVCGIGCVSAMFVPPDIPWLLASASFVGKFGVGSGFAVIYIFAGELYPTVVRAIGMGMSSMVAGSGLLLAPHIVKLGDYMKILPLLIMGIMALSAGTCAFFLPETLGAPLPMTIEDAENFGKRRGLFIVTNEQRKKRKSAVMIGSHSRKKAYSVPS